MIQTGDISLDGNFFEIGGDSLIGAKLVSVLQQRLGLVVSLDQLLSADTLGDLAEALHEQLVGRDSADIQEIEI